MSKKSVNITLKQKEIRMFKLLRRSTHELGGSIELGKAGKDVREIKVINGTRTYVTVDSMPISRVNFHSHPSIPSVPNGRDIIEYALEQYTQKKLKDFPVNIFVMPISDDDMTAMTTSLVENRNCVMMIFCPEGIYTLFRTRDNGTFEELKNEYRKETKWLKAAREYLRDRDDTILNDFDDHYLPKLKKLSSLKEKKALLSKFQKRAGNLTVKLVKKHFSLISAKFYTWNVSEIKLRNLQCKVCPRIKDKKACKK